MRAPRALLLAAMGLGACAAEPGVPEPLLAELDLRRCRPGPGTTGSPNTIEEAVALANSLPFPVTTECFVEALDRPLRIEASSSEQSVQPARGARSPRVFVWPTQTLVMTLALDGPGRDLVEFGQFVDPERSIKAELAFPIDRPVDAGAPFDRVRNEEHPRITTCFVCHDEERDEPAVPGGRSSVALRPLPATLVSVATLTTERERCDPEQEPARCRYLEALVGRGPIERRPYTFATHEAPH